MTTRSLLTFTVAILLASSTGGFADANPRQPPVLPLTVCPALYALGIQGTGESSPDASLDTDTGMVSAVFRPMLAVTGGDPNVAGRAYVAYDASFGGAVGASKTPYSESVATGVLRAESLLEQLHQQCPATRVAIVAYSQGSHVASILAQTIGAGAGVVPADLVSAVVLFADPTRAVNASLFPGAPEATTPAAAPGTTTDHLRTVARPPVPAGASGGGIGPVRDVAADFGALSGRVASLCIPGDLACDAPANSPVLRAVAGIAGQSVLSLGDPIASLASISQALAFTSIKTATAIAAEDLHGDSVSTLKNQPAKSISQRLAEAADPRTPVDTNAAFNQLARMGTIGLAAVNTVIQTVLNPATLIALAQVTLSNPSAALTQLRETLSGAVPELTPPVTTDGAVTDAFAVIQREINDNRDLLDLTTWMRYSDTARHDGYTHTTANAPSPASWAGSWLATAALDAVHSPRPTAQPSSAPTGWPSTTISRSLPADGLTGSVQRGTAPGAPTTAPTGPSPVEVVGAPPQHAAPPQPADPPSPAATPGPGQPGIALTAAPAASTAARQPGISPTP